MIRDYFKKIEEILSECPLAVDLDFHFTVVDLDRGFWRGLVEYVVMVEEKPIVQVYRYHFQDKEANLVFRHDNASHHPELKTHPHHLHTPEGSTPVKSLMTV